jgi:hypothetical protein
MRVFHEGLLSVADLIRTKLVRLLDYTLFLSVERQKGTEKGIIEMAV